MAESYSRSVSPKAIRKSYIPLTAETTSRTQSKFSRTRECDLYLYKKTWSKCRGQALIAKVVGILASMERMAESTVSDINAVSAATRVQLRAGKVMVTLSGHIRWISGQRHHSNFGLSQVDR